MKRPTRLQIATEVCFIMKVRYKGPFSIRSTKREERLVSARSVIVHVGKHYGYSYPEISLYAGYSGHSGAHEAHGRLRESLKSKSEIKRIVKQVVSGLDNS